MRRIHRIGLGLMIAGQWTPFGPQPPLVEWSGLVLFIAGFLFFTARTNAEATEQ